LVPHVFTPELLQGMTISSDHIEGSSCPFSIEVIALKSSSSTVMDDDEKSRFLNSLATEPALVPVSSTSDSDDSSQRDEEDNLLAAVVVEDSQPMDLDCLSDQFTNLFCPSLRHPPSPIRETAPMGTPACTEFPDLFGPSNHSSVFSSLSTWWGESQGVATIQDLRQRPRNRNPSKAIEERWSFGGLSYRNTRDMLRQ